MKQSSVIILYANQLIRNLNDTHLMVTSVKGITMCVGFQRSLISKGF